MIRVWSRRDFLQASVAGSLGGALCGRVLAAQEDREFQISLNELSLERALRSGRLDHLDLPRTARKKFDIAAVEYASRFFAARAHDQDYLNEMNKRAAEQDVRQLLIMVEGEGSLGDPDASQRQKAVRSHYQWVDAAAALGCHSIEVDTAGTGTPEEWLDRVAPSLAALCQYADPRHINILVGWRGDKAVDAGWTLRLIGKVGKPSCGALPSFGGLAASKNEKDVTRLVSLAKGISAVAHDFDAQGRETHVDFLRVASTILSAGYRSYVGIVYQGGKLEELEGIRATKRLLEAARAASRGR